MYNKNCIFEHFEKSLVIEHAYLVLYIGIDTVYRFVTMCNVTEYRYTQFGSVRVKIICLYDHLCYVTGLICLAWLVCYRTVKSFKSHFQRIA